MYRGFHCMRVLRISANTENINMVPLPLGLNCVAVAARDSGHQGELLDLMSNADHKAAVSKTIGRVNPQVIGFSVRNVDNQNMGETRFLLVPVRSIISLCRIYSKAPIVVGGASFSIFPVAALRYLGADMGVCGEGEMASPLLLDTLEQGGAPSTIAGLCLPGNPVPKGCAEPWPPSATGWSVRTEKLSKRASTATPPGKKISTGNTSLSRVMGSLLPKGRLGSRKKMAQNPVLLPYNGPVGSHVVSQRLPVQ